MFETLPVPRDMFSSNREHIDSINNNTLRQLTLKERNKSGDLFVKKTIFLEGVDSDKWEIQGEAFNSNSSDHFKEESLKKRALDERIKNTGKQAGVSLPNRDSNAHQCNHYLALVPRDKGKQNESIFFGLVPDLHAVEQIEWKYNKEKKNLQIDFIKRLDKTYITIDRQWDIQYGQGNINDLARQYRERYIQRMAELKQKHLIPDKVTGQNWWFSWPHYGKWITQKEFESQIPPLKATQMDTMVLDDGWMKNDRYGDWEFDKDNFPNPKEMIEKVNNTEIGDGKKMRFGLWLGPFLMEKNSDVMRQHPDWVLRDEHNRRVKTLGLKFQRHSTARNFLEPVYGLDISRSEVQDHLINKILALADMGVKDFKMDFLGAPFLGVPHNKNMTMLERQFEFWHKLREKLNETHPDVRISGCTVPLVMMPLFDSFRITNDSSFPPIFDHDFYKKIFDSAELPNLLGKASNKAFVSLLHSFFPPHSNTPLKAVRKFIVHTNSLMYQDAAKVLEKRLEFWGDAFRGASVDGLHSAKGAEKRMFDPKIIELANGALLELIEKYPNLNVTFGDDFLDPDIVDEWHKAFPHKLSPQQPV